MNCCCSSPLCRQLGCQANKSAAGQQQYGGNVLGGLGGPNYQPYAELTGGMNRLAAAIEKYNVERAKRDPT